MELHDAAYRETAAHGQEGPARITDVTVNSPRAGERLEVSYTFDQAVTVATGSGTPFAWIRQFVSTGSPYYLRVPYERIDDRGRVAIFTRTMEGAVRTRFGIPQNSVYLNRGVIADSGSGNMANLSHGAYQFENAPMDVDATAPRVVSVVHQTPASTPTNANCLTWRVTFNENVANVDQADFAVGGTTATWSVSEVTASTVYDVTASGGNLDSLTFTVTLTFANNQNIADLANNPLTNTAPTGMNNNTYDVDNTKPTVTITGVPPTSSEPFTATLAFSEAVNFFGTQDITVGNGAASAIVMVDAMTYTARITPSANGTVTVDVAADVTTDAAGNGNTAAARATSTYTMPILSISVDNERIAENGGTATVTIGATTPFGGDQIITLVVAGTATENTDYSIDSKSLTLTAGQTSVTTTIAASDDADDDDDETVIVRALTSGGDLIGAVTVTITDDDAILVSFDEASYTATEGGATALVMVSLSRAPSAPVTIPLTTTRGGGATTADYSGIPRTLSFSTTDMSKTITVTATDDAANDDGESVTISFGNLPAGFAAGASTTVNLADDEEQRMQGDVSGKVVVGQTLTADTSGITDGNGLGAFAYRWRRDGTNLGGIGSSYTLVEADAGKRISVQVSFTDGGGNAETRVSPRTSRVILPIRKLVGPAGGGLIHLAFGDETRRTWSQGFLTGADEQGYLIDRFRVNVDVHDGDLRNEDQVVKLFAGTAGPDPIIAQEVATLSGLGNFPAGAVFWTGNAYAFGVELEKDRNYVFAANETSSTSRFNCGGTTQQNLASDGLADWGMGTHIIVLENNFSPQGPV